MKQRRNKNRREIADMRTANRKVFENQDHSRTVEIYLEPIHYQDLDGAWKDMDDSLEEDTDFRNRKGALDISLHRMAKESRTVSMKKEKTSLSWGMEGCHGAKARKQQKNLVIYPEIFEGADLRCRIHGEGVKEDLILHDPKAVRESYCYIYRMKGLQPVLKDNRVSFLDDEGNEAFCVHAPCMKDAGGEKSEAIRLSLEVLRTGDKEQAKECRITFVPDMAWLGSTARLFPVIIDPVTTTSKKRTDIADAHVDSLYEEDNFQQSVILKTMGGDKVARSFVRFDLPEIKTGDMVINARLVLVSLAQDGKERTVAVHKVLQGWHDYSINWYNKPLYSDTVEDLCTYKGDAQKYITLDITRMVKNWYQNGGNCGLMFKSNKELSGYTEFLSADCDDGYQDMRPRIEISYVNYSGLEDYWSYHSQSVGRAGNIHVNDYNGNLILIHDTMATGGSLMPVSLSHVYNSNNRTVNLGYGYGFALSYHQTLKKLKIAGTDYYQHVDGDGTVHYFYYDTEKKKWLDESGSEAYVTIHADAAEQLVIHDKENNQLLFRNGYLVKVKDKNGNVLTVSWSNNRIIGITDGAGRKTVLSYLKDSNGKLTYLQSVTAPSGKKKQFSYSGGNLVGITDIDGKRVSYIYDSRHMLTDAADIDGYHVKYEYYGTSPYRVKKITEYAGTTEGNSLTLTYGYNSTKFTDNKNRVEICRFNNSGNLLHIHDGFGHAASAKYNRSGNHVNCLENATKLQTSVVQLLKDPIIQAAKTGWNKYIGTGGAGSITINTDKANCKVGDRSLKLDSTTLDGYICWLQDVTLKKGSTYTFSMYVKTALKQAASDGGAMLRIRYIDGTGAWIFADSEKLTGTTDGFVRLFRTFTLPEDAKDTSVRVYFYLNHATGTAYADMAQLETGSTASRCNLVDNGDFHLGSTYGFKKTGYFEDGLTSVGTSNLLPINRAITVTAAGTPYIYDTPSLNGKKIASAVKGTHLFASVSMKNEGREWYRVENAAGQKGYFPGTQARPYLSGNNGDDCGAVGISGAILRAEASDTGAVVEEVIPKGTGVVIRSTVKDASGQSWYYVGMQIDKKRYYGYIRQSSVIRLCRNYPLCTMKQADKVFYSPSLSGTAASSLKEGQKIRIRGVLQNGNQKWYAVLQGKEFGFLHSRYCQLNMEPVLDKLISLSVTSGVGGLDSHIFRFYGDPQANKRLTKVLDLTGKKGDTYMVNAWGRGTSLPETDNDKNRRFGVEVVFVGADGKNDVHYTNFSPDIMDWQFLGDVYVAKQDYTSIKISYTYCKNANMAFFDGLSLYREEFGQSYTYDDKNNVISAVDAQRNASRFEYNEGSDLTGITDPQGNKFRYEYDKKHNVIKGTSAMGVVSRLRYDEKGNITKSGTVQPDAQDNGIWVTRSFTTDKNHVAAVADAEGNVIRYSWDLASDRLLSLTDGRWGKLTYGYDSADRMVSVEQQVAVDGVKQTVKNTYGYTGDDLTSIDHNGFRYGFSYDGFGSTTAASIAGKQVVGYTYEPGNGNLVKTTYANGHEIRYTYDDQDRMTASFFKASAGATEQKLNTYVYNKEGNLCQVTNHMSGKTYYLDYDLLDRLMRVRDEKGSYYEYTYDSNNHMRKLFQQGSQGGAAHVTTTYSYDKDGREKETRVSGKFSRVTDYDSLGRVQGLYMNVNNAALATTFEYGNSTGSSLSAQPSSIGVNGEKYFYEYDANGNITSVEFLPALNSTKKPWKETYQYDERNQLIRENSQQQNKTFVYAYDLGGNLTSVKEYPYTEGTITAAPLKTETGTYASGWKDQLVNWNGTAMTYDAIGNMLARGNTTYSWTLGRKLAAVDNGKKIQYFYDHTGSRTKKVVDGVATEYRMAGDLLMSETTNGQTLWFTYDSNANLFSMVTGGKHYFYQRNLQNDIIALVDEAGDTVVNYTYDSWGKVLNITGSRKDTIGQLNPFRYRGYYYDKETGMYYLKNRYYDPELRRFISSDAVTTLAASTETLHNRNLYTYCNQNPITRSDSNGNLWTVVAGLAGAAISLADQLVFQKKEFDWKVMAQAVIDGISMAVSFSAVGAIGQGVVNAATTVATGVLNGDDGKEIAFQAVAGGISGWRGGKGVDIDGKRFKKEMHKVYDSYGKKGRIDVADYIYRCRKKSHDRVIVVKIEKTVLSTAKQFTSSGINTYRKSQNKNYEIYRTPTRTSFRMVFINDTIVCMY